MAEIRRYFPHIGGALVLCSAALVAHLGQWESGGREPVLVVYADRLAGGIPTVCDGITRHVTATPIIVGDRWTPAKCEAERDAALERVQTAVAKCFTRLPPQPVYDMASSHAWNFGAAATCGSGAMQAWNAGQWETGCMRISRDMEGRPVWSYVRTGKTLPNGKPELKFVQGLANRRADETAKCLAGVQ